MTFYDRFAQNRFLDVALCAAALVIFAIQLPGRARQNDFAHYYVSSRLLLEGQQPYGIPLAPAMEQHGFSDLTEEISMATNPPLLLWIFAPLAALPPSLAFALWVVLQAACLFTVLWLTKKLLGDRLSSKLWRMIVSVVLVSPAVYWHFHFSQVQFLLAVLVVGAMTLHVKHKHVLACLLVTLAGMIKLFPFVLLPWFLYRQAKSQTEFANRAAAALALMAVCYFMSGPALWEAFFTHGRMVIRDWAMSGQLNYTVPSLLMTTARIVAVFAAPQWDVDTIWPLAMCGGLTLIAWAYWKCLRDARNEILEFSLLSLVMVCGGATGWVHYHVFLILPITYLVSQVVANPTRGRITFLATAVLMLFLHGNMVLDSQLHRIVAIALSYIPLGGLLMLVYLFGRPFRGHDVRGAKCRQTKYVRGGILSLDNPQV